MDLRLLVILFLAVLAYRYWPKEILAVTERQNGNISYHFDEVDAEFKKVGTVDATYRVHGMEPNTGAALFADGFLALMPVARARELLAQYPEMDRCDGDGNGQANQAAVNTMFIYDRQFPGLPQKVHSIKKIYNQRTYSNPVRDMKLARICVHIKGSALAKERLERKGNAFTLDDGGAEYMFISDMDIVDCHM